MYIYVYVRRIKFFLNYFVIDFLVFFNIYFYKLVKYIIIVKFVCVLIYFK